MQQAHHSVPAPVRFSWIVALLLVPIAVLIALLQKETSRPEVLDLYMNIRGDEVYAARVLPRLLIQGVAQLSLHHISAKYANHLLQFASAWGTLWFVFLLARRYAPSMTALAATFLAALFPMFGFLGMAWGYAYPYDLPIFFFSTVGLWAIVTRRFVVLAATVLLGTLTKETMVWVVAAFLFLHWRQRVPDSRLLAQVALLLLVFFVAYLVPRGMLHETTDAAWITALPSAGGRPRLLGNLEELLFLQYRGGVQHVYLALSLHAVPLLWFRRLPHDLQRLYWAAPVFLLPHLLVSNIWEIRLLNEIIPLGSVCTLVLLQGFGQRAATAPNHDRHPG
jgi:hypothetical protein